MTPQGWISALLRASLEGGAVLILIWLVTRLWPRMPAAARCGLWWLGALRMLAGLAPLPTIPVVWKPLWAPWAPPVPEPMLELTNAVAGVTVSPAVAAAALPPVNLLPIAIVVLWLAGMLVGAVLLARRMVALHRAWRSAVPFEDPRVARWQNEWAVVLGRASLPEVRIGAGTRMPVAFGALRPGLLMPADSARLSDDALRMVFAHEMSHVRRLDPLLGWVPAMAELLFWFHPLVRLAAREYLAAREQVCDADALRATGVSPRDYGALLLDFGVARVSEVPGAASCASRGSRDLRRRLDMLSRTLRVPTIHRVGAAGVVLAVMALAFAPIRFVAAHESQDTGARKAEKVDEKLEVKKKTETRYKTEYGKSTSHDKLKSQMLMSAKMQEAYEKALEEAERAGKTRSPIAYMIKVEGREGTRGAVDIVDIESADRLDREDRSAVYFRLGEDMWISYEPSVMKEVLAALGPEDDMDDRLREAEARLHAFEQHQMELEKRREDIERDKAVVERDVDALEKQLAERRAAGRSADDLKAEKSAIEDQMQALWQSERDLRRLYDRLAMSMRTSYEAEKASHAERERIHAMVMENIAAIGRRAVKDGRAERFVP